MMIATLLVASFLLHGHSTAPQKDSDLGSRIRILIGKLDNPDLGRSVDFSTPPSEGEKARDELIAIGKPAVPALIAALRDKNGWRRVYSIEALGALLDPRAVEPILKVLKSDHEIDIRAIAARALGPFRDKRTIKPLIASLKYRGGREKARVAHSAACALADIGDPIAIRPMVAQLGSNEACLRAIPSGREILFGDELIPLVAKFGPACTKEITPLLKSKNKTLKERAQEVWRLVKTKKS